MGLIEILIAVFILSIGLLGMAWVQTRALSNSNSSMARSMAVVAAYSILDAMRADRANAMDGDYNTDDPIAADDCPSAGSSLASTQLNSWCLELGSIQGPVESTTGAIDCDDFGTCDVTITFEDSRVGNTNETVAPAAQTVVTKGML